MDFDGSTRLSVGVVPVFGYAQDLATYPRWFSIVDRADPLGAAERPAWSVDLAARVGPFKRTKRVRMVRTVLDPPGRRARFERDEGDGRQHSEWALEARVDDEPGGCVLHMHLHYSGVAWIPGLDLILREEAKRAGARLERLLWEHGHAPR